MKKSLVKKLFATILALCMLMSFVACSSESASSDPVSEETSEEVSSETVEFETLNVGTMALTMGIPVLYAEEQGYFEDAGLNLNIELFATGAPINEAIAANQLDIAVSGFASVYSLANANCTWVADVNNSGGNGLYARSDSEIAQTEEVNGMLGTAETLKGLQILEPLGTAVQYMTESYAAKLGLQPDEINQLNMEYATAYQAFTTGEGDLMAAVPPYSYQLEDEGYVQVCSFEEATEVELCDGVFARNAVVEERKEEVQLFVNCLVKAMDDLQDEELRAEFTKKVYDDNAIASTEEGVAMEIKDRDYIGTEYMAQEGYELGEAWIAITDFLVQAEKITPENAPNVQESVNDEFISNLS